MTNELELCKYCEQRLREVCSHPQCLGALAQGYCSPECRAKAHALAVA